MDAYKTPESDLTTNEELPHKPVKTILLSLTIAVVLISIASIILAVIFGLSAGINFSKQGELESLLNSNPIYLVIDILLTFSGLWLTGIVVAKNTPKMKNKYVIIVSLIILTIYIAMLNMSETNPTYPVWYSLSILLVVPIGIYFGSEYAKK